MLISDVRDILGADIICGHELLGQEVRSACGADLMSDVLAFVKDQSVLLTGLLNTQVIRTADMMDIRCVIFVRGKIPDAQIVEMAKEKGIVLMHTKLRMYTACGKLYSAGLGGSEYV
jgi:predicted transcriptional regulator